MSKRILSAALALALSLSLAVPAFAEEESPFDDVPLDHWAIEAIRQAAEEYIVSGMDYQNFAPDAPLTSAQFVTIITRAFYWRELRAIEEAEEEVREDWTWYVHNRETAEQAGLMEGVGVEDWDAPMTRYQMAAMLYNVVVDKELALPDKATLEAVEITDWDQVPEEFQEAVSTAYAMGLLSGMEDGSFAGDQTLTRAQAAVVYTKLDQALEVKDGLMERALDKAERTARQNDGFLSTRFIRYPGKLGTAYYVSQGGTPHGANSYLRYVDLDGTELDVRSLLPEGYVYGSVWYFPVEAIRFDETGEKLSFVTKVQELTDGPSMFNYGKDWGNTKIVVNVVTKEMESMEPVRYTEYWDVEVEQDNYGENTSDCLTVTLTQESGIEDIVVQESNIPFSGVKVSLGNGGISVTIPESLMADPDFLSSEFGQAVQLLRDMDLPGYFDEADDAKREQTAPYVQAKMNGVPLTGDVRLDPPVDGAHRLCFRIAEDADELHIRFLDGDALSFRVGLPQE